MGLETYSEVKGFIEEKLLDDQVYTSFEKVENDGIGLKVVLFDDPSDDSYEVHVVGFEEGEFGEYAVWQAEELKEDEDLAEIVWNAIYDVVSQSNMEDAQEIAKGKYGWYFTAL